MNGGIKIYEMDSVEHSDDILGNFLSNVWSKFVPSKQEVILQCNFKFPNIQLPLAGFAIPIINSRYLSTNTYRIVYFNDYWFCTLREEIKKELYLANKVAPPEYFTGWSILNSRGLMWKI